MWRIEPNEYHGAPLEGDFDELDDEQLHYPPDVDGGIDVLDYPDIDARSEPDSDADHSDVDAFSETDLDIDGLPDMDGIEAGIQQWPPADVDVLPLNPEPQFPDEHDGPQPENEAAQPNDHNTAHNFIEKFL
jgi:hypothetical protein